MSEQPSTLVEDPQVDRAALLAEFQAYLRAQALGEFEYRGDPNDAPAKTKHEADEFIRFKRVIELTAILRRENTGPAKPKKAAAGTKGRKSSIDVSSDSLLD